MKKKKAVSKKGKEKMPQKCQQILSVADPQPKVGEKVEVHIEQSEVQTCQSKATWVDPVTHVHYCDFHKETSRNTEEYSEYEIPPTEDFPMGD
jgi:hypothetical protein